MGDTSTGVLCPTELIVLYCTALGNSKSQGIQACAFLGDDHRTTAQLIAVLCTLPKPALGTCPGPNSRRN